MAILLGLMVFLILVSEILPTTSDAVPLLSKYLLFTFLINVLVGMFLCASSSIYKRSCLYVGWSVSVCLFVGPLHKRWNRAKLQILASFSIPLPLPACLLSFSRSFIYSFIQNVHSLRILFFQKRSSLQTCIHTFSIIKAHISNDVMIKRFYQ